MTRTRPHGALIFVAFITVAALLGLIGGGLLPVAGSTRIDNAASAQEAQNELAELQPPPDSSPRVLLLTQAVLGAGLGFGAALATLSAILYIQAARRIRG